MFWIKMLLFILFVLSVAFFALHTTPRIVENTINAWKIVRY